MRERKKKYTKVIARCCNNFKRLSMMTLSQRCNCTISDAYNRYLVEKTPLCIEDTEVFERLSDVITKELRLSPRVRKGSKKMTKKQLEEALDEHFKYKRLREEKYNELNNFRTEVERGSQVIRLGERFCKFLLKPIEIEMVLLETEGDWYNVEKLEKTIRTIKAMGLEGKANFNSTYQICVDFDNKSSKSYFIRNCLDCIWDVVPRHCDDETLNAIDFNEKLLQAHQDWMKNNENASFLERCKEVNRILENLRVPTYESEEEEDADEV